MRKFDSVEDALEALRQGKIILVTDDEDRENEGDFICAAEYATTENVNFMAKYARGLICMPMSAAYCERLGLPQMVSRNTDNHETAFTVSFDYVGPPPVGGRRSKAGGLSQAGAYVSASREEERRAGA